MRNEETVVEETVVEEMVEEQQENTPQNFVTMVVEEEGGVAGLEGSSLPAATGSSSEPNFPGFRSEEVGPSSMQRRTSTPMLNPRRLIRQGGNAVRQADANLDMVGPSRMSIDLSRELLQAIAGLFNNMAALATRQSEDLAELIVAVRENTQSVNAMWQLMVLGYGTAPQGAIPPMVTAPDHREEVLSSYFKDRCSRCSAA
uniref:uncharacterized protein n=1 Tax=Pristiophorus japonicus TaxID=55135 RepID=UPI00398EC743